MKKEILLTAAILGTLASGSVFAAGSNTGYNNVSNGDYGTVFGSNNTTETSATSSLAFGDGNVVKQANSMAFGQGNVSDGENSFVGGDKAKAIGRDSFAFGSSAQALTEYSVAIGSQARSNGQNTVSIGNGAYASNMNALSVGRSTEATGIASTAVGYGNKAKSNYATAMGYQNTATGDQSSAFGSDNEVTASNAVVVGNHSVSSGDQSFVAGFKSKATNDSAVAVGNQASATANHSLAIGTLTEASKGDTVAIGHSAIASGELATAIGSNAEAKDANTIAIGVQAKVSGVSSIGIGRDNNITGDDTTVVGANNGTITYDDTTGAVVTDNTIKAAQSAVFGYNNVVQDASKEQLIFGSNSTTKGQGATVIGSHAKATAIDALALGNNTIADVQNGVAIGTNSVTELAVGTSNIKDNTTDIRFSNSTYAGSTPDSVVSFGTNGRAGAGGVTSYTRQLQNVAAGRVSSTSTDAINGSQLYDVALEAQKYNTMANGFNTTVVATDNAYGRKEFKVNVNKDLVDMNSAAFGKNTDSKHTIVNTDGTIVFDGDKDTKYGANGLTIEDRNNLDAASYNINGMTASDANGTVSFATTNIDAGNNQIHNVKAGTALTDAVNVSQLRDSEANIYNTINSTNNAAVNRANHYTDLQTAKVGARAAAMANLHYQDFNADDKWSFAAGYGHYKGQNAGALGVAYQPNENTMISVSSTIGSDTMIGAGLSMKFGKSSKMNANKQVAMAKEIQELREIVAAQNEKINMLVDQAMGRNEAITDTVFPDVPENHWAYMMVQDLAYKGIVTGYPDGNYNGERTLTRYEFAVALDRAISAGYMNPELGRAIKEFKPELDSIYANMRFRVDRLSGKDGSVNKVERVRVNKNNTRDNYGTIVK